MSIRSLVKPPRLRSLEPGTDRKVTWLELFFDLVFAAALSQVAAPLSHDYSLAGLFRFSVLFLLIWWAWAGHTTFSTRFDTDDLVQRLLTLLQMFAVAVMAVNAEDALGSRSAAGFAAAYAAVRLVLVAQYWRATHVAISRPLSVHFFAGHGAAALLWLVSSVVAPPGRFWIWAVAFTVDFGTPILGLRHTIRIPPDAAHLPERFGLFTIILLGESMIAIMQGMESQEYWSASAALSALCGMCLIFLIWWWYFDEASGHVARQGSSSRHAALLHVWGEAHVLLFLGIVTTGVGIEHVISVATVRHLEPHESWILSGGVALVMASLTTIGAASRRAERDPRPLRVFGLHWALAAVTLGTGAIAHLIPSVVAISLLAALCLGQVALSMRGQSHNRNRFDASSDRRATGTTLIAAG